MPELKPNQNYQTRLNQTIAEAENKDGENFRLGIILLSIFILILLIILGAYLFRSKSINQPANNQFKVEEKSAINHSLNNSNSVNSSNIIEDFDNDGLSTAEEKQAKTDPTKIDTDGDGLTDREEVKTYKTDPLKIDTDNDGKSDGEEIKSRHDPLDSSPTASWPPLKK